MTHHVDVTASPTQDLFGDAPTPAPRERARRGQALPPARHTWFFALRPEPADTTRLDAVAQSLLARHGIVGKRIGPDRLHVTLELVGHDATPAAVDAACRAAGAVRWPAIDLCFDAVSTFSAPSGPFVLLGGPGLDAVRGLRTALGCAMADEGFAPPKAYEPHLTLAYDPRHRAVRTPIDPIAFHAASFALVKSHIGLSRHEVLRTWPLGD